MKRTFLNSESISEDTFEKEEQIEYDLLNQISELFTVSISDTQTVQILKQF